MKKRIEVVPYLSFKGDCEEAIHTYIAAFDGAIQFMSRWSEDNFDVTSDLIGKVMHVEFPLGSTHMAAGDSLDTVGANTDIKLMIHMDSQEEALLAISLLAEGGSVLSPLRPHPAPDDSGCGSIIRDRFGFTWAQIRQKNLYRMSPSWRFVFFTITGSIIILICCVLTSSHTGPMP